MNYSSAAQLFHVPVIRLFILNRLIGILNPYFLIVISKPHDHLWRLSRFIIF